MPSLLHIVVDLVDALDLVKDGAVVVVFLLVLTITVLIILLINIGNNLGDLLMQRLQLIHLPRFKKPIRLMVSVHCRTGTSRSVQVKNWIELLGSISGSKSRMVEASFNASSVKASAWL